MTPEKYREQVTVIITPEAPEHPDPRGGFTGEQTFWLHTIGMHKFDRPEMEMRGVPGLFIGAAGGYINHWAYHSIAHEEVKAGENVMDEHGPVPVVLQAHEVTDPWYTDRGLKALALRVEGVLFSCDHNHDDCGCDDPDDSGVRVLH